MTYDALNRMTEWRQTGGGAPKVEKHVYRGAEWHRAGTVVKDGAGAAKATAYLYDGDDICVDMSDQGGALAVEAFYVTPFLDQNLLMIRDGKVYWYSQDGLGSVRTLRDAGGGVVNRYDYTAFGETWAPGTSVSVGQRYTFTGREASPLGSIGAPMYYRYRGYFPGMGRFGGRDPIGEYGGVNLYTYAENSPVRLTDRYGLTGKDAAGEEKKDEGWEATKQLAEDLIKQAGGELDQAIKNAMKLGDKSKVELLLKYTTDSRAPAKVQAMSQKAIKIYLEVAAKSGSQKEWLRLLQKYGGIAGQILGEVQEGLTDFLAGFAESTDCMNLYKESLNIKERCDPDRGDYCECMKLCSWLQELTDRCVEDLTVSGMTGGAVLQATPILNKIPTKCREAEYALHKKEEAKNRGK